MEKTKKKWMHFWRNKSIFTKTFILLSVLSFITVIAMFLFVNKIVTSNHADRIRELNVNQLRRAGDNVETHLENMEQTISQTLTSSDFISIMVSPFTKDSDKNYRIVSTLAGCVSQSLLVKRAFLYLPTTDEVYSSAGNYIVREQSGDRKEIDRYLEVRAEGRNGGEEIHSRILFTKSRLFLVGDFCVPNFIGALFFEIDTGALSQVIQGEAAESVGYFQIFDENGMLILTDASIEGQAVSAMTAGLYQDIDASADTKEDGYPGGFLQYRADGSGLVYGIYVDPSAGTLEFLQFAMIILPFLILYAVFAEFYSLYISRSIYKPINRLMQITAEERKDVLEEHRKAGRNEIDYLEMAFQDTLRENTEHRELLAIISRDVTEQMFRSVLGGKVLSKEYIQSTMTGVGLEEYLDGRYMALAGILLTAKDRELSSVESGLYQRSLMGFFEEFEGEEYIIVPFFMETGLLAVILGFREEASVIHVKHYITDIVEAVNRFTERLPYSIVFGKGKVCSDITSVRFSYQEALEEVQYLCYMSEEPESEIPALDAMSDDYDKKYFSERGQQVAESAEKDRREDAEKAAFSMVHEISECSPENRQTYWELVMDIMVEKMIAAHITKEEIKQMKLNQVLNRLAEIESTEEMRSIMNDFFVKSIKAVHTSSRKNRYRYVETAKEYISAHYSDGNLSLNEVSEAIGISSPYLSGVFAEVNNGGFSSYLSAYRVEQAKQFLEETTHSVAEIGYKCGFNSAQSFSRVFKKVTGYTPGRYRESRLAQREETSNAGKEDTL